MATGVYPSDPAFANAARFRRSALWAAPLKNYVTVSGRAAPAFVNIDAEINGAACWINTNAFALGFPLSYEDGVATSIVPIQHRRS